MEGLNLTGINIWIMVKILSLILLGMYLIFSLVVVRQVKLMTSTLSLGFESQIKLLSFIHLAFAILVFLVALIIL
jgi:hypothetical protein